MSYDFKKLTAYDNDIIKKYASLRPIYTSEGQFMNQYIWSGFYQTEFHVDEAFLFFRMKINNEYATMMPYCKTEDIVDSFFKVKDYFNNELHQPLKMYIVDSLFLETLKTSQRFLDEFTFEEDRSCFDYVYDAEKLRTLSGKKYHKKKNHVNGFLREYDGRYEYRTLCCSSSNEIKEFHQKWLEDRQVTQRLNCIISEEDGVSRLLQHCGLLDYKIGGIYVDDVLEAYSIGSYNPALKCAFIHIEKANINMKGLYNFINQQFLIHEFPEAELVNREDDLGQEGLRKSKLSYQPIRLEEKFNIVER